MRRGFDLDRRRAVVVSGGRICDAVQFRLRLKTVLLNGTICGRQPTLEQPANELALISGNRDFQPEQLLNFIELRPFTKRWAELGLDAEDDLTALQLIIMGSPKAGAVIKGLEETAVRSSPMAFGKERRRSNPLRVFRNAWDRTVVSSVPKKRSGRHIGSGQKSSQRSH
jgi:hypothetical protein